MPLEHYVNHLEEHFNISRHGIQSQSNDKKSVFVATDDPNVLIDLRQNFSSFTWMGHRNWATTVMNPKARWSKNGPGAIIKDIFLLAMSNFVVCTFSSNVCRVTYALRLALMPVPMDLYNLVTLDSKNFGFQYGSVDFYCYRAVKGRTLLSRLDNEHMDFKRGDLIRAQECLERCRHDPRTGQNRRPRISKKWAIFPKSKTQRIFRTTNQYQFTPFHFIPN